jgi:hypothetical protein
VGFGFGCVTVTVVDATPADDASFTCASVAASFIFIPASVASWIAELIGATLDAAGGALDVVGAVDAGGAVADGGALVIEGVDVGAIAVGVGAITCV